MVDMTFLHKDTLNPNGERGFAAFESIFILCMIHSLKLVPYSTTETEFYDVWFYATAIPVLLF